VGIVRFSFRCTTQDNFGEPCIYQIFGGLGTQSLVMQLWREQTIAFP
jgi:hypothetical protein